MSFPISPTNGQTTVLNNIPYIYNSTLTAWVRILSNVTATNTLNVYGTQTSTSTNTGALVVNGGVGIGGAIYVGGPGYIGGQQIVTTATLGGYGVTSIIAGTDTAISTSTGAVTIWNTSTLQSVTSRGNSTNQQILITNTLSSTSSFSSNALYVAGGIGGNSGFNINGNSYLTGNLTVNGTISGTNVALNLLSANSGTFYGDSTGNGALYAGVLGYTPFAQTMFQASGNLNNYMEINVQNINPGAKASTDIVASADDVTVSSAYIDMGIASSTFDGSQLYSLGQTVGPNDGYLMVGQNSTAGLGDLVFGTLTSGTQMRFVVGPGLPLTTTITNAYVAMTVNPANTTATSTTTGALVVIGGVGIGGSTFIGGNLTVAGTINASITANTATNVAGGTTGSILYQILPNVTNFITVGSTGSLLVSNGTTATFQSSLSSLSVTGTLTSGGIINTSTVASTSTTSGALTVAGGVGVGGSVYINNTSYVANAQIVTTGTINQFAVTSITAGTDTAISTSTGAVIIWNTGTLQSVTNRGNTTTNAITISNSTIASSTTTGALTVTGGVGIGGSTFIGGNLTVAGTINASITANTATNVAGGTTGSILYQVSPNVTGYIGIGSTGSLLVSNGTTASYSNTVSSLTITSYASSTSTNTGALQVAGGVGIGGNLVIGGTFSTVGTGGSITGATLVSATNIVVSGTATSTSTTTGALTVTGGVGIGGNVYVGGSLTVSGNINATITGVSSSATNITNGTTGSIVYQTAPGQTGFIGIGNTGSVLASNGSTATFVNTLTLSGTVTHGGLVPSQGLNIDQIYSTSTNITLTTNWQNTGISGNMLTTGTYIIQALANDSSVGGGEINTYYSGIMSWYAGATTEGSYDEIVLHRAGAASGSGTVYLQVLRSVGGVMNLQIAGNTNNSTTSIYYLNFRRML